jgi:leucyl aminopeptidase
MVGAFRSDKGPDLGKTATLVDETLDGALGTYLSEAQFKGKVGEMALIPTLGRSAAAAIAVCGLGPRDGAGPGNIRRAAGHASRRLAERNEIVCTLHEEGDGDAVAAAVEGLLLGAYRFTEYKTDQSSPETQRIVLPGAAEEAVEKGRVLSEATALARDLINEPPSALTPEMLATRAAEVAGANGLACEVLDEKALAEKGFGGLLGVGRGSDNPPRFIELHHRPDNATGRIALVGKGVTFDSGGLSLKDAKNMEQMKTDMAGAAAVIGTMGALGRLGIGVEVIGLVAATENLPGYDAMKPGDVLEHYGGKTSEVLNTDAEGRLILADALAYAGDQEPDAIVDLATLTGAIMVALGRKRSGLFCNDEALAGELMEAADTAGEQFWRMPLDEDFEPMLASEVADIKNTSGSRYGGAVFAAMFLKEFVAEGIPWAHLDIAGAARAENDYDEVPKGGSGVGVRTLLSWLAAR